LPLQRSSSPVNPPQRDLCAVVGDLLHDGAKHWKRALALWRSDWLQP
jgi:hypothetical protein